MTLFQFPVMGSVSMIHLTSFSGKLEGKLCYKKCLKYAPGFYEIIKAKFILSRICTPFAKIIKLINNEQGEETMFRQKCASVKHDYNVELLTRSRTSDMDT